ncbi:HEAT repeat domain-containing protein [Methanoregula sp.]|uniref:HEAT repeat domain-containing protein n=1 Tax=Methanoregula sp. TaxID=2052170 RepID=UPI00261CD185|nr:HEAT repeat domain-containing protein [Methanoregula sp.]MDD5142543.1 HEAT repeat domain-containing protein [Methanoregula sp.]
MSDVGRAEAVAEKVEREIARLSDPSLDVRHAAVTALQEIGEPAVVPLLKELGEAGDNDRRWYAAVALSRIGAPAIAPLIEAMKANPAQAFRRYAAATLGGMGEPAVIPLIDAMASDEAELRGFLSQALCRIGGPAIEPLRQRLHDADEIVRSCATLTLWKLGEAGVPAIVEDARKED